MKYLRMAANLAVIASILAFVIYRGITGAIPEALPPTREAPTIETSADARVRLAVRGDVTLIGHHNPPVAVAFSADSRTLVSTAGREMILWDLATRSPRLRIPVADTDFTKTITFCVGGKVLAAFGPDGVARLYNTETGDSLASLKGSPAQLTFQSLGEERAVAVTQDGKFLAAAFDNATVRLLNVETRQELPSLKNDAQVRVLAFSADGRILATSTLGHLLPSVSCEVKLWDWLAQKEIRVIARRDTGPLISSIHGLAFSPDGRTLALIMSGRIIFWDLERNTERASIAVFVWPPDAAGHSRQFYASKMMFSPDGKFLAGIGYEVEGKDGKQESTVWQVVRVWDAETAQVVGTVKWPNMMLKWIALSPDWKSLAVVGMAFAPRRPSFSARPEYPIDRWHFDLEPVEGKRVLH